MKQKNLLFRIFLVIFLVAVAGIIGLLVRDHIQKDKDQKLREKAAVSVQEEPEVSAEAEETPVQIPVDFSVLQAENPDIYAWIHIADTPVDYPILQSKVDDDYYMDHTVDDKEGFLSLIFSKPIVYYTMWIVQSEKRVIVLMMVFTEFLLIRK